MAISTLRKATLADEQALAERWTAFCDRLEKSGVTLWKAGIDRDTVGSIEATDCYGGSNLDLIARWDRIASNALGYGRRADVKHPICIAYGYVGRGGY